MDATPALRARRKHLNTLKKVTAAVTACLGLTACTNVNANTLSGTPSGQPTDKSASAPYNPTSPNSAPTPPAVIASSSEAVTSPSTGGLPGCNVIWLAHSPHGSITYYIDPKTGKAQYVPIIDDNFNGWSLDYSNQLCAGLAHDEKMTLDQFCSSAIGAQLDPDRLLC